MIISGGIFDENNIKEKIENLDKKILEKNFWKDKNSAQKVVKEKSFLEDIFKNFNFTISELKNLEDLFDLAEKENDIQVIKDCEKKISSLLNKIKKTEVKCFLSAENDHLDTYLEIHAGAGGTESQDWAQMLVRMYLRWAEKNNFKFKLIHETIGDEAGIKSCTALIEGSYAFGYLKNESGIHRLVRISPFDSNSRRHTSFSSVWISPHVEDDVQIEILDKDLRVDTFRASGAGGQHVNTTDSAIRITHLPTNIVVQCQNERSQHKNKATAMNLLRSKLYELEIKKMEDERKATEDQKTEIGWGNQIRSYVLHPYRMVKDLRSNFEDPDPEAVLDGNIEKLIKSNLRK